MSRYEKIIAALNEPVFELDTTGRVVYATSGTEALIGLSVDYFFADALSVRERTRFEQAFKRIVEGKTRDATLEIKLMRPSSNNINGIESKNENKDENDDEHADENNIVPIELKLAAITKDSERVSSVAGWLRDMTVDRANETAAVVQGTHLLDLVEHIAEACVVEDRHGNVEMVNDAFCNLFNIKAASQSLVGMKVATLFADASAMTEKKRGPSYAALESTEPDESEFTLKTGAKIKQQTRPATDDDGMAGRLHIFSSNETNEAADGKAVSATTAVQVQLIEKVARELASTVEGAGSAIYRAEQLELPGQLLDQFKRVEASAQSAFGAMAGLIDFNRLESSEIVLESSEFHLREGIASMLERLVPLVQERGINVKLRIEQDVPEHLIGDGGRLLLALRNLMECSLHNSDRYADLSLTIAPEYVADNVIHLSFSVEHTQPKGSQRGKGLTPSGALQLALARQIVRAVVAVVAGANDKSGSGRIEIRERKESVSYQFTAAFSFRNVKEPRLRPAFVTLTGLPVLIVSADTEERKQLAELARGWRMHVREADDAEMALHLLMRMTAEETAIPLVISANQMPVQDGFVLAFRIKHQSKLKQTAVMMLAKGGKPGDAIQCRENSISAYLRHPIIPDQLNDAIAAVMGTGDDAEATQTLITRHSLREAKAGTVLLIDANKEHAAMAAKALRKKDYRAVVVETAQDAFAALLQDIFDVVVVDVATPGFGDTGGAGSAGNSQSAVTQLRAHFGNGRAIPVLLADSTPDSEAIHKDNSEYDGVITKPYDKNNLAEKIGAKITVSSE